MRIAVMQPYLFPYIGYFQLVSAVNEFVFYDDVNFIKGGWINRNRILVNGEPGYFSIACKAISSFKTIRDTEYELSESQFKGLIKKLELNYSKAPFKNSVLEIVHDVFKIRSGSIADLAVRSVSMVSSYLELNTRFKLSSSHFSNSRGKDKFERLVCICKALNGQEYVNPIGGIKIYDKPSFSDQGIKLFFIETNPIKYHQAGNDFSPNLSILDVLMFNDINTVKSMLNEFKLV